jgi:ADP-heptose:LPS heptosyltransferase
MLWDPPRGSFAKAGSLLKWGRKVRSERYDAVYNFHASPSSALIARASGARVRAIHFHGLDDANRYSTVEIPGKGRVKPATERDLDTLRATGLSIPELSFFPSLHRDGARIEAMKHALGAELGGGSLLMIAPGASRPAKQWPIESFAKLADLWLGEKQGSVVVVGTAAEASCFETFTNHPRIHPFFGRSLADLQALMGLAAVFVGNDSGPKHLAAALGVPTLTLFGPNDPFEWHPYDRKKHPILFVENLPCRVSGEPGAPPWCGIHTCTVEKHRCMTGLSAERALEVCEGLLNSSLS